jgi:hypothetical protein
MKDPIPHLGNPDDQSLKKYIVTLKNFDDSTEFYDHMETDVTGIDNMLPARSIECVNRRPSSRNTEYMMTYDEAAMVCNDSRVLAVELNPEDLGFIKTPFSFEQTSAQFNKATASSATDINWGLLRVLRATDIGNWGSTGTINQSASIISDSSGRNVDVVIMDDGCPYPTTLEYQKNPDGTGYSRMVEYNWYQHNPVVTGGAVGEYSYSNNRLQEHGSHTTGTVAGNTQGWARDANIFNITYIDSIDYVREFHKNKPVNPLTGVKNPTVMNNSWGYRAASLSTASISKLTIRGVEYFPTSGTSGSYVWDSNIIQNIARLNIGGAFPSVVTAVDTDMIEAMAEGIIIVASAGNSYFYQDVVGGLDYNNTMVRNGVTVYIHRGSSPGATDGGTEGTKIICSGASGQHNETSGASVYDATSIEVGDYKAEFSNYGPRIDCYAPGSAIQSIWKSGQTLYDANNTTDPRVAALGLSDTVNNNFKKCPGTSMSGPQTAGVLACLAEKYPRMTQTDARAYIKNSCPSTILSTSGGAQDFKDAGPSFNSSSNVQMLILRGTRHPTADVGGYYPTPFPSVVDKHRPPTGQTYPRRNTVHSFNKNATFALSTDYSTRTNGQTATITLATTNIPNGTLVQYLITAKPASQTTTPTVVDNGLSGIFSASATILSGFYFDTRPSTGNRFETTSNAASNLVITNNLIGAGSLTLSTPTAPGALTFTGYADDGYWTVPLPFNITYLNQTYSSVYIGTNTYITFGGGSEAYAQLGPSEPPYPKIMISAADNKAFRIYQGVEGTFPTRTFRIRWEGHHIYNTSSTTSTMIYEATFYEQYPTRVEIHTGVNARWALQSTIAIPPFSVSDINKALVGTMTVNSSQSTLPITISTSTGYVMNVRLGVFPSPSIDITIN